MVSVYAPHAVTVQRLGKRCKGSFITHIFIMLLWSFKFIHYVGGGVAKSVTRVGDAMRDHCGHGVGNLLARSVLDETLAILAGTHPADVILAYHIMLD